VPPITTFSSDAGVAGFAQRHEIAGAICAAVTERENVVHFFGWRQAASFLALLTQRVCLDVAVANALPGSAVALVALGVALKTIVMVRCLLLMLCTVKTVGQLGTAGVLTGALWFLWHSLTSIRA
jgi:hypothetical protein